MMTTVAPSSGSQSDIDSWKPWKRNWNRR